MSEQDLSSEVIRTTVLTFAHGRLSEGKCIDSETIIPSTKELGSDFSFRRRLDIESLIRGGSAEFRDTRKMIYSQRNSSITLGTTSR